MSLIFGLGMLLTGALVSTYCWMMLRKFVGAGSGVTLPGFTINHLSQIEWIQNI